MMSPRPVHPWQPPRSEYAVLWHGCTETDKDNIEANGIQLQSCRGWTDFGQGFYTMTRKSQAIKWAWIVYYRWRSKNNPQQQNRPVILRFRLRRYSTAKPRSPFDRGLDGLRSLHFVRGDFDNEDYWSFVQHCRQSPRGGPPRNHLCPHDWYEMVAGPVAARWDDRAVLPDADQFSFHPGGIDLLNARIKHGMGAGKTRGNQASYSWEPLV